MFVSCLVLPVLPILNFVYFDALNTENTACNYNFQSGQLLREDAGVSWFLKSVVVGQFSDGNVPTI